MVTLIIPSLGIGGVEKIALSIAQHLKCNIIATDSIKDEWSMQFQQVARVYICRDAQTLKNVISRLQNTILVNMHSRLFYECMSSFTNHKIISCLHNCTKEGPLQDEVKNHKYITKHVTISKQIHDSLLTHGIDSDIIYNGVDPEQFKEIAKPGNIVAWLGRFAVEKNPEEFIRLAKRVGKYKYKMYGNGYLKDKLIKLNESLGYPVEIIGFRESKNVLPEASCLIMTSLCEGFPLVALEALCCNCYIYSTLVNGIESIVLPEYGKIIDVTQLSELNFKSISSKQYIADRYNIKTMIEGYKQVFGQ